MDEAQRCERHQRRIVGAGPKQILHDRAFRGARQADADRDVARIATQKCDSGRLDRDIRAASERESHVCRREGRGVVDTVTDEGDAPAGRAQLADDCGLAFGRYRSIVRRDPECRCDVADGAGSISANDADLDAERPHGVDGCARFGP